MNRSSSVISTTLLQYYQYNIESGLKNNRDERIFATLISLKCYSAFFRVRVHPRFTIQLLGWKQ